MDDGNMQHDSTEATDTQTSEGVDTDGRGNIQLTGKVDPPRTKEEGGVLDNADVYDPADAFDLEGKQGTYTAETVDGERVEIVDKVTAANSPTMYLAEDGTVYIQDGDNGGLLTEMPDGVRLIPDGNGSTRIDVTKGGDDPETAVTEDGDEG